VERAREATGGLGRRELGGACRLVLPLPPPRLELAGTRDALAVHLAAGEPVAEELVQDLRR
jgi:hypothetical protein